MNSSLSRTESHLTERSSKSNQFGYEKKNPDNRSVQSARSDLLSLVPAKDSNTIFRLFCLALPPFNDLLETRTNLITSMSELELARRDGNVILSQPQFIRETVLRRLLPNFKSLQSDRSFHPLLTALTTWGQDTNLPNDWCLDHGLATLREWDVACDKKLAIALMNDRDIHCMLSVIRKCWDSAVADRKISGLTVQFQPFHGLEERGVFSFEFEHENLAFRVHGPFSRSWKDFRSEVNQAFKTHGGSRVRGAMKALGLQLDAYRQKVESAAKEFGLEYPSSKWATSDHVDWLLQYQLPPCKSYRQIGRDVGRDESAVREGVKKFSELIGLTLRSSDSDKRKGRPVGAKDKYPRHRVDGIGEKLRGNSN